MSSSNLILGSIIRLEILPGAFSRNFVGCRSSVPSPRFSTSTIASTDSGSRRALLNYPPPGTPNTVQPHRKCARYRSMSEIDRFVFPAQTHATPTLGVRTFRSESVKITSYRNNSFQNLFYFRNITYPFNIKLRNLMVCGKIFHTSEIILLKKN